MISPTEARRLRHGKGNCHRMTCPLLQSEISIVLSSVTSNISPETPSSAAQDSKFWGEVIKQPGPCTQSTGKAHQAGVMDASELAKRPISADDITTAVVWGFHSPIRSTEHSAFKPSTGAMVLHKPREFGWCLLSWSLETPKATGKKATGNTTPWGQSRYVCLVSDCQGSLLACWQGRGCSLGSWAPWLEAISPVAVIAEDAEKLNRNLSGKRISIPQHYELLIRICEILFSEEQPDRWSFPLHTLRGPQIHHHPGDESVAQITPLLPTLAGDAPKNPVSSASAGQEYCYRLMRVVGRGAGNKGLRRRRDLKLYDSSVVCLNCELWGSVVVGAFHNPNP